MITARRERFSGRADGATSGVSSEGESSRETDGRPGDLPQGDPVETVASGAHMEVLHGPEGLSPARVGDLMAARTGSPALDRLLERQAAYQKDRDQRQTINAACAVAGIVPLARPGESPRRAYTCPTCEKTGWTRRKFAAPGDPVPTCDHQHTERQMELRPNNVYLGRYT